MTGSRCVIENAAGLREQNAAVPSLLLKPLCVCFWFVLVRVACVFFWWGIFFCVRAQAPRCSHTSPNGGGTDSCAPRARPRVCAHQLPAYLPARPRTHAPTHPPPYLGGSKCAQKMPLV